MLLEAGQTSDFLLNLYRNSHRLRPDELQRRTLHQLRTLIPFDFAAWGAGKAASRHITELVMLDQTPRLFTDWAAVAQQDDYCSLAMHNLNRCVMFEDLPGFRESIAYREHWDRFDARRMLATIMAEPTSGCVSFIGLCREDPRHDFTELQRQVKQQLLPHIGVALRLSQEYWDAQNADRDEGVAIVSRDGLVLCSRPSYESLARDEWGESPLTVPADLMQTARAGKHWRGRAIEARLEPLADHYLLRAQPLSHGLPLTDRERVVAELFASGMSNKAVARTLDIAPATVRNHLSRIYDRLGIHSKSELIRLLG